MIVGIRLNDNGKTYYFNSNGFNLKNGDNVIVETEKGLQFGEVVCELVEKKKKNLEYKNVIKIANKNDHKKYQSNLRDAEKALIKCNNLISEYGLEMKVIDASYTFDREQLIFRFISDNRVDFRQLAKDLGGIFKTRIELRQVGIRDKAKEIGGFGPCGRKLCCNNFLTEFDSVSINMAKNQNLALNPSKINGLCGRLYCCLSYEDEVYSKLRKELPEVGEIINKKGVKGKVISLDILNNKYRVETEDKGIVDLDG